MLAQVPTPTLMQMQKALEDSGGATLPVGSFFSGCEIFTLTLKTVLRCLGHLVGRVVIPKLVFIAEKDEWKRQFINSRMDCEMSFGDVGANSVPSSIRSDRMSASMPRLNVCRMPRPLIAVIRWWSC